MMRVKCIDNNIKVVRENLQDFAYTQDENGIVDLTVGKEYLVFGVRNNDYGKFYLLLTDSINTKLPWWIPEQLFEITNHDIPAGWQKDTWNGYGKETIQANPIYFDAMEDIEDRTPKGYKVFDIMRAEVEKYDSRT